MLNSKELLNLLNNQDYREVRRKLENDFLHKSRAQILKAYGANTFYTINGNHYISDNCSYYRIRDLSTSQYLVKKFTTIEDGEIHNFIKEDISVYDYNLRHFYTPELRRVDYIKHMFMSKNYYCIDGLDYSQKYLDMACQLNYLMELDYFIESNKLYIIDKDNIILAMILPFYRKI